MDKNKRLWQKANTLIPGGSLLLSKSKNLYSPEEWPTYYKKAKGIKVWDLEGNCYYDFATNGIGACSLGYGVRNVDRAARKAIKLGVMATLNCPEDVYLSEKLIEMHPWADMARFARTGGEANAIAIRTGRNYTKKDKVAICGYHGWHDWYLSTNLGEKDALENHLLKGLEIGGIPKSLKGTTIPIRYNNFEDLDKLLDDDIGVLKMEIVRNELPDTNYLEKIQDICRERGIVIIADECTSGFREAFGGIHLNYKFEPDIAVFGKAIANGYAMTAVIGKRKIMDNAQETFISSTFWTERIGPCAALATLEQMSKQKSWETIPKIGKEVKNIWKEASQKSNLEIKIQGIDGLPTFSFVSEYSQELKTGFTERMLKKNILATTQFYPTTQHREPEIAKYRKAVEYIFDEMSTLLKINALEKLCKGKTCRPSFERLN